MFMIEQADRRRDSTMELKLAALFLALAATPVAARQAKPYEVVYRATVSESLCLLLPGHPTRFVLPSTSQSNDRLEVSCKEKRLGNAPEVELKFWLDADVPTHYYRYFRWGPAVAGAKDGSMHGQFTNDPGLCQKVTKILEEVAKGAPSQATLHLRNAKLTIKCNPDARWVTSLELHLVLNQP
jgi:hypothetical protein